MKIYRVVDSLKCVIEETECEKISEKSVFFKNGQRIARVSSCQSFHEDYKSALEYSIVSTKDKIEREKTKIAFAEKRIEELKASLIELQEKI